MSPSEVPHFIGKICYQLFASAAVITSSKINSKTCDVIVAGTDAAVEDTMTGMGHMYIIMHNIIESDVAPI